MVILGHPPTIGDSPGEVTSSYTNCFHSLSCTMVWPCGSAVSDGDHLIRPSPCPSREFSHTVCLWFFFLLIWQLWMRRGHWGVMKKAQMEEHGGQSVPSTWVLSQSTPLRKTWWSTMWCWELAISADLAHLISLLHPLVRPGWVQHLPQSAKLVRGWRSAWESHHHVTIFFWWPHRVSL